MRLSGKVVRRFLLALRDLCDELASQVPDVLTFGRKRP